MDIIHSALGIEAMIGLLTLVSVAVVCDLKNRIIPNTVTLSGLVAGLALGGWVGGTAGFTQSLAGLGLGLLLTLPGFLLRFTGGGDVKLIGAIGSLTGPALLLQIFISSILLGGAVILIYVLWSAMTRHSTSPLPRYRQMLRYLWGRGRFVYIRPSSDEVAGKRIPLAPIIAVGTLGTLALAGMTG